jgi:electron transfer flavoprotein beta subunit
LTRPWHHAEQEKTGGFRGSKTLPNYLWKTGKDVVMKIAVLIKPVLDCGVRLAIDKPSLQVTQQDQQPQWIVNPADRAALEAALALKHQVDHAEIAAVSYVPSERTEGLHFALARGADRGIIIEDDDALGRDAAGTAAVLSAFLAGEGMDLILCGNQALDNAMSCVGPSIAELLDCAQATGAVRIAPDAEGKTLRIQRRLEKGNREEIQCSLPAAVTVDSMIADPVYVSVYAVTAAQGRELERRSGRALVKQNDVAPRTTLVSIDPPRPRPKRTFIPDTKLSAAERMKMIRSGGMTKKKKDAESLSGSPESSAEGIISFLQEKGILQ